MHPFGMATFIVKADLILDESDLTFIYRLNKNLKFCIELKEYLHSFLLEQLRGKDTEQVFTFNILLKHNLGKKKNRNFAILILLLKQTSNDLVKKYFYVLSLSMHYLPT